MCPASLYNLLNININITTDITITITIDIVITITISTHINETILPSIEEVSMEAVPRGVIEGVVQLVPGLVDPARSEESLEEDGWKSLIVRVGADSSSPARVRVDHVRVSSHVLRLQSPVPAAGERHLRPDGVL